MSTIVQVAGFYAASSGGLRTTVDALGREYRQAGHEPVLVIPGAVDRRERVGEVTVITLRSPRLPATPYRVLLDQPALLRALDRAAPDRLEVHDKIVAVGVARWADVVGVPSVLVSHERLDGILARRVPPGFPLRRAADWWNRRLAAAYEVIVCASAYAAEEFLRIGAEVTRVPLGVDLDAFAPRAGARTSPPQVAWVGRLSAEKRPDLAVAAFRELVRRGVDARLVVLGDGPLRRRTERQARGLPVTFAGHVPRGVVADVLGTTSVLLAPCPVESFGLGVLEAMAGGTPVVVPTAGAARELVAPGAGLAVDPSAPALAGAAVSLLGDPDAGTAARRRAEAFPWQATGDAMLALHGLDRIAVPC